MDVMNRRQILKGGGVGVAGLVSAPLAAATTGTAAPIVAAPGPQLRPRAPLAPIKASMDRLLSLESCLRPFRPAGPRIELERVGNKAVVHNYGHGGSGWSLSWGSARQAIDIALTTGAKNVAVIGAGAIGLTTAVLAQRSGLRVRIYTKDIFPFVRSARATGVWSPSARIVTLANATREFRQLWERMARYSYYQYSSMLGLSGNPIEWTETYKLSDTPFAQGASLYTHVPYPGEPEYPHLEDDHTPDLMSGMQELGSGEHPFPVPYVRRVNMMMYNIPTYAKMLMEEFHAAGGEIVIRDFESPRQFADIPEHVMIHCTGYAAKSLVGDDTLVPVRGQTAKLIPQPEVDYCVSYDSQNVYTISRRDGMIVQEWSPNDYNNEKEQVYLEATRASVNKIAALFAKMGPTA